MKLLRNSHAFACGLLASLVVLSSAVPSQRPAQQAVAWPDYRGPDWNGHAAAARVPLRWDEKTNVQWKVAIPGTGWSTPVVAGNRAWLSSSTTDGRRMFAVAIDVTSGRQILERDLFANESPAPKNQLNSYASPSPVIDAERVYFHFGTYGTACLDNHTGETLWKRQDIPCDHIVGPGSSPVLVGDLLIFNVDGGDVQYVIALDKKTGKTRWKRDRSVELGKVMPDLRKAFSTPILVDVDGKQRLISSGAMATMAYDPATGEELWRVRHPGFSMASRPIAKDGVVFLNTGFMSARLLAVKTTGTGDVTDSNVLWTCRRSVPKMPSPVVVGNRLYMVSDDGVLTCLDSGTGKKIYKQRLDADHCASLIYANGRIYLFDREGRTTVIAPGDEYRVLATNRLDAGFMASPAVVGDAFLLRTKTHLYRIEEAAPRVDESTTDWARFRGPNGTGISPAVGLPVEFGPDKNVVWKRKLPPGHSSPVIVGDRVFLTAVDNDALLTYSLDRESGRIQWKAKAPRPRRAKLDKRNSPASATPVADDDTVIVFFEDCGLLAYSHDGRQLWQLALGPFDNEYGMGASPVLLGDRVYLPCDQSRGSYFIAVSKRDGKLLWKTMRPHAKSGHCTPIVYQPETGAPQLVLPGSFSLDAYDSVTGERVWWVNGLSFEMKSTPVLLDGTIYINGYGSPLNQPGSLVKLPDFKAVLASNDKNGSGSISKDEMPKSRATMFFDFVDLDGNKELDVNDWEFLTAALASKNGMLSIRAGGRGDMSAKNVIWTYHRTVPQLPSPLVYGGVLYMLNDQSGLISTLDPQTGGLLERGRLKAAIDNYYASPIAGDGKIYIVSEHGLVSVLPKGGSLQPLAVNDLADPCYATPAIAGGQLFIRTRNTLYCFGKE